MGPSVVAGPTTVGTVVGGGVPWPSGLQGCVSGGSRPAGGWGRLPVWLAMWPKGAWG